MKTALALGTFDGLHTAHRKVLDLPCGYKKTAITFEKPPKMFFEGKAELLMSFSDKVTALESLGFSKIIALDFEKVRGITPKEFLEFLRDNYNPAVICCGFNYRFGKNGEGDTELIKAFCRENDMECIICEPISIDGETVSSTRIRKMLKDGQIEKANGLLYKPFSFEGMVIDGEKRGRKLGFPTINQKYPADLVQVKFGVYKTEVTFDGEVYSGVTNIGLRPTFGCDYVISETHIKGFSGDLYGKNVRITLKEFLREEMKFANAEELQKQVEIDKTK